MGLKIAHRPCSSSTVAWLAALFFGILPAEPRSMGIRAGNVTILVDRQGLSQTLL